MTDLSIFPEFEHISKCLGKQNPSEIHGMLCGILCIDDSGQHLWLRQIVSEEAENVQLSQDTRDILLELFSATASQINDHEMRFYLLLPDDECALSLRAESLACWCQGFLFGLGLGGLDSAQELPAEVWEFLEDLRQIAQLGFAADEDSEDDEQAYTEIVEYVRVGVMLVQQTLQPPSPHDAYLH